MLTRLVVLFFSLSSIESFLKFFKVLWKTSHPSEDLFTITITYVSDPNELAIVLFFSLSSIGGGASGGLGWSPLALGLVQIGFKPPFLEVWKFDHGFWRLLEVTVPQKWIWESYSLHIWIAFDFAFPIRYIMIGLLQVWFWRLLEVKILEVNWHIWIAFDLAFPMIYIMIGLFDVGFWRLLEVKIFLEANVNMMYHFGILRPNAKQLWSWNLKNLEKNHFDLNLRLKEAKFQTCFFMA